jgi:hypothetical protein
MVAESVVEFWMVKSGGPSVKIVEEILLIKEQCEISLE